jgi:hypothetical protein
MVLTHVLSWDRNPHLLGTGLLRLKTAGICFSSELNNLMDETSTHHIRQAGRLPNKRNSTDESHTLQMLTKNDLLRSN